MIKLRNNSIHDNFSTGTKNNKNLIINGSFNVHQRGTSDADPSLAKPSTADLWIWSPSGNSQTIASSIETDVPTELSNLGLSKSLKATWTTAQDGAQFNSFSLKYPFEQRSMYQLGAGPNCTTGMTLSFWVKSNKTLTSSVQLDITGSDVVTDAFSRQINVNSFTISSADTWEKKIINIPAITNIYFIPLTESQIKSVSGGRLQFYFYSGSYWSSTSYPDTPSNTWNYNGYQHGGVNSTLGTNTGDYMQIAGVQLEKGSDATEFEVIPYNKELNRCKRYFQTFGDFGDGNVNGNRIYSQRYGTSGSMVTIDVPVGFWHKYGYPEFSIGGGGSIDTYFINSTSMQLYDASDSAFYIYDLKWRALIA